MPSRLHVRKKDLPALDPKHRPEFRTKLEMAVELLRWAKPWLDLLNLPIWVVTDGAYATKDFLKPAMSSGMTVTSRLRKDSALRSLPGPKPPGRRGPAPTYGKDVIDLAKPAGQRRGWSSDTFESYGEKVVKKSVPSYVPGSQGMKFRPPPTGCSAWRRDINILTESTDINS